MNFIKQIERINRVDKDIKQRITGNPEEFAMILYEAKRDNRNNEWVAQTMGKRVVENQRDYLFNGVI